MPPKENKLPVPENEFRLLWGFRDNVCRLIALHSFINKKGSDSIPVVVHKSLSRIVKCNVLVAPGILTLSNNHNKILINCKLKLYVLVMQAVSNRDIYFYKSVVYYVENTGALTNFCVAWLNMPPPTLQLRVICVISLYKYRSLTE